MVRAMRRTAIFLLVIAIVLALISISTDHWYTTHEQRAGLWKTCNIDNLITGCTRNPNRTPAVSALAGVILLLIGFIISLLPHRSEYPPRYLSYVVIVALLIGTVLLVISYISYANNTHFRLLGYSYFLMVIVTILTLIAIAFLQYSSKQVQVTSDIGAL
ncbi:unnamed protein product [Didymodactylos carnosus]|uniref:Uncharacterized protein n=1 Tax=Didymodactylos carnosus TaxID=1234261 RepID=A0A815TW48_9BILA|nr:unnamed protein product [Didymodactylos carnosus]CAF1511427.1 unnamed protein product [Didymodactylos carnosus]CAF4220323.1 unnamed protein product [Didymodactylos carnosus]CAF4372180.1 unnamed protein product [Didymodactylos carnosus]